MVVVVLVVLVVVVVAVVVAVGTGGIRSLSVKWCVQLPVNVCTLLPVWVLSLVLASTSTESENWGAALACTQALFTVASSS